MDKMDELIHRLGNCDECESGPCLYLAASETGDVLCCLCQGRDPDAGHSCHHCRRRGTAVPRPGFAPFRQDIEDLASSVPGRGGPAFLTWIGPSSSEAGDISRLLRRYVRARGHPILVRQTGRVVCAWRVELGPRAEAIVREVRRLARELVRPENEPHG